MTKKIMIPLAAALAVMLAMLVGMGVFYNRVSRELEAQAGSETVYDRHYMMISSDDSALWQAIYESARKRAREENIYLEWTGASMMTEYTTADCMRIAMASDVDGIILYPDGEEDLTELIDEAADKGIPVVTVLNDVQESRRISYVGVNTYQMGELYGTWVLDSLKTGDSRILVFMDSVSGQDNENLIYSQMYQVVENGKREEQEFEISTVTIEDTMSFDTKEAIRDIFVDPDALPDVLICMDSSSTECAYQALIDYNKVGAVEIVGYYITDTILDAINKNLIPVTLTIDTEEIGIYSVEALNEYLEYGHVNNYYNVDLDMVTKQNVQEFMKQQES